MAAQDKIATLTVRGVSDGLDKVAGDLDKVAAAQERVSDAAITGARVTDDSTKKQLSAAGAFNRLATQLDPVFRGQQQVARGQAILDRALNQGVIDATQYEAALARLNARYASLAPANTNLAQQTNSLAGQTGNLAAQFNDIATQLAGGQSPFLIAMQQGTQISQVLGGAGGARGAVAALGGAFMSLISPINLVTIGAIALGGALLQYMTSAGEKTATLDERLQAHADLIRSLKDAYGDAAKGLDDYVGASSAVIETQMRAQLLRFKGDLQRMALEIQQGLQRVIPTFNDPLSGNYSGPTTELDPKYKAFESAIARLNERTAEGTPNIRAFREEVARIAQENAGNVSILGLADQLLKASAEAGKVDDALQQAARAIQITSGAAGGAAGDVKQFTDALKELGGIALPNQTDADKAALAYGRALEAAGSRGERAAADAAYLAALDRAGQREAEKAAEEAKRKAEAEAQRMENGWKRSVDKVKDQTRALQEQAATYGQSAGEVARYRAEQELLNAAQEAGKDLTPELRAQITEMAVQAGEAADQIEKLRQAAEWSDFGKSALSGFIGDLRQGKTAAEAFTNALDKLLDKLIDLSLNALFDNKQNPLGGLLSFLGGGSASGSVAGASGGVASMISSTSISGSLVPAISAPIAKAVASASTSAANASMGAVEAYVREAASVRGIDPNIAARVINQESGFNINALGDGGKSFGVMQLYTGGGLGNEAMRQGISLDSSNWKQQVDFGFDVIKKDGWRQWYGARDIGVGRWDGIAQDSAGLGPIPKVDVSPIKDAVKDVSATVANAAPQLESGFDVVSGSLTQGGQNLGSAFSNVANSLSSGGGQGGGGLFSWLFGGGSGGGFSGTSWGGFDIGDVTMPFANGGIMTSGGPLPLNAYANGGVADRPQLALFGEGRKPEAYVPLPDGRTIPVTMQGGGGSGITNNIQVINNTGAQVETQAKPNGNGGVDFIAVVSERTKQAVVKDTGRNGSLAKQLGVPFNGRG